MKEFVCIILLSFLYLASLFPAGLSHSVDFIVEKGDKEFDHLYLEDRDDLFYIQDFIKDTRGFMWVAAKEGLYRYDSREFLFLDEQFRMHPLAAQGSWLAFQKDQDTLWIAHSRLICHINTNTLELECYETPLKNEPSAGSPLRATIYRDQQGIVYAGYWNGGLVIFDPITETMEHLFYKNPGDSSPFKENTITDIQTRCDSTLWIASHDGLFIYDRYDKSFHPFIADDQDHYSGHYQFNSILLSRSGTLWLGSNNGLLKVNPANGESQRIFFEQAPISFFERNFVESLTETSNGTIWIGTRYGLYSLDHITRTMQAFYSENTNPKSLQRNYVRKVYTDENDILWIGHHSGGISLLTNRKKSFTTYTIASDYIAEQRVHSVYADNSRVWFGTETGLFVYNRDKDSLKQYRNDPADPTSISHNFVSGILEDQNGIFWISTDKGGLNRFDPSTGRFENVIKGSHGLATQTHTDIWSIYLDNTGVIWCGTGGNGLTGYHTGSGEIIRFRHDPDNPQSLSSNFIGPVVRSIDGTLWIGTNAGLNYLRPSSSAIQRLSQRGDESQLLSATGISSLCLTPDHKLYMGTSSGIEILNLTTLEITPFSFNDKLPGRRVKSVVLDKTGNFWIATQRGLMKYEPATETYQIFGKSDGLPSNFFIPGSYYHASTGEIFMGTQNGLIGFFPWDIEKNTTPPPIAITDIRIIGQSLIFDNHEIFINPGKELILPHFENNITFSFSSLDYNDPAKNQLRYMLTGFDKQWITDGNNGLINYNNLPPGHYTFRVVGSNNDNIWNREGVSFSFIIKPPFWDTLWFKTSVFMIVVASIFGFIYLRIKGVHKQKKHLEKLVAQRTAELNEQKQFIEKKNQSLEDQKNAIEHQALLLSETNRKLEEQKLAIEKQAHELKEMDRIKSGFFASISHEFRTPLTLILNAICLVKEKGEESWTNDSQYNLRLSIIEKNAQRLHRLIDQLLDLMKIESGFMKLIVSEGNISMFVRSVVSLFLLQAREAKINLETSVNLKKDTGFLDWDKLEKIIYNLLSNAIRFTPPQGRVELKVTGYLDQNAREWIRIRVMDTGCGIPAELHEKVFTMFYHSQQAINENKATTGIGLSLARQLAIIHKGCLSLESEPAKGTVFTVDLPVGRDAYHERDISATSPDFSKIPERNTSHEGIEIIGENDHDQDDRADKPRVLFVDDNRELCLVMRDQLKIDFHVELAFDGIQGFEKSITRFPDIIVSDLMMPGISGIEFCQRIKEDIRTEHLPFILLTARMDQRSEIEALKSQADDYITKPYSIDVLMLKLRNQLESRKKMESKLRKELDVPSSGKQNNYSSRFMKEAVEVIHKHMDDLDFTVDNLAFELNMSRTQLYRKSEKLLGMTANSFIKKIKLNYAHELLNDGEYNVTDIAYKVGFKTPGYFSKCFEEQFGILPSKYLSESREKEQL